jgi:GNAT superfamily N-acetyltransferase
MTQIAFREAAPADADLIANLHAESWRHAYRGIFSDTFLDRQAGEERRHYWHARLADLATKDSLVLLAEANGSPVGFVCVETQSEPEWGAFVDNLHVLPRHQGQGIGKRLAAAAVEWARAASAACISGRMSRTRMRVALMKARDGRRSSR